MFDPDNRDRSRARSLLALGPDSRPETASADSGAAPSPARPRREAASNPLLDALARSDGGKRAPVPAPAPASEPAVGGFEREEPRPASARGLRAMIRDRLLAAAPRKAFDGDPAGQRGPVRSGYGDPRDDMRDGAPRDRFVQAVERAPARDALQDDQIWRPLIDPMTVIMGVVNSKTLIAATTLIGALLGVAIALSTPKEYEALTEILVDPRDLQLVERDLTGSNLPSDATLAVVENQARVLTSGTVLNQVVDKLNLTSDPEFNGEAGGGFSIGSIVSELRSLLSRRDAANDEGRRRSVTINNLADSLTVERGGKTFVISVGVKTRDPDKSALIANAMTSAFLEAYGRIQADTAGRATQELTSRLDELRAGVEAAERKVEDFKAKNDLVDAQGKLISDEQILKLNEQLSVARARTLELDAKAASTKNVNVDDAVSGTLPEELTSNVMIELRAQYAALQQEANRLSVRLGPRHPQRQAIEAQLDGARAQIANEMRRIVGSTQTELQRAVRLEQELSSRLAQLKVKQGDVSGDQVELRELEREAAAKRAVYEAFLLRAKQTGEQKDINTANMSVISKAYPPLDPVGPSRSLIAITGMLLGMFAGAGIGAARGAVQSLRDRAAERSQGRPARPQPPEPFEPGPGGSSRRTVGRGEADDAGAPRRQADAGPPRRAREPSRWLTAFRGKVAAEETAPGAGRPEFMEPRAEHAAQPPYRHAAQPPQQPAWQPQPPAFAQPPMPGYGYPAQPYPQYATMPQQAPWPPAPVFQQAPMQPQPAAPAFPADAQAWQPVQYAQPPAPAARPVGPSNEAAAAGHGGQREDGWREDARLGEGTRRSRDAGGIESLDDIRDSLREFREAVDHLSRSRARRRYS